MSWTSPGTAVLPCRQFFTMRDVHPLLLQTSSHNREAWENGRARAGPRHMFSTRVGQSTCPAFAPVRRADETRSRRAAAVNQDNRRLVRWFYGRKYSTYIAYGCGPAKKLPSVKATGGVSAGYPVIAAAKRQRRIKRLNLNVRRNVAPGVASIAYDR